MNDVAPLVMNIIRYPAEQRGIEGVDYQILPLETTEDGKARVLIPDALVAKPPAIYEDGVRLV